MTVNVATAVSDDTRSILVDGIWRAAACGRVIDVVDPSDGTVFSTLSAGGREEVEVAVASARKTFEAEWGETDAAERGAVLMRLAGLIERDADELGAIESRDTGKPLRQGRGDAMACAR